MFRRPLQAKFGDLRDLWIDRLNQTAYVRNEAA